MPLNRYTPLRRTSGLKRTGHLERKSRLSHVSKRRNEERNEYRRRSRAYLAAHPFCQVFIAIHGLVEADVIASCGRVDTPAGAFYVPPATEIHHRNKGRGRRLNDERWWLAASRRWHDYVESRKDWARQEGYLLPLEADEDGKTPSGERALETPEFLEKKALLPRANNT